jgi:hypothetical protein
MQADFLAALHEEKNFTSMETLELADFEGKKAYTLRLIRAGGDTTYEYFDAESGLLVGTRATRDTQMGPMTATTVMTNYKDFGGIQMPTRHENPRGPADRCHVLRERGTGDLHRPAG